MKRRAFDDLPDTRATQLPTSVSPWPHSCGERDEQTCWRFVVERTNAGQRNSQTGIEDEAIPVDARSGSDGVDVLTAEHDRTVMVADCGKVPEAIAFNGSFVGTQGNA